ncbi:ABC transporter, substrate-binding protein (cluster 5, nickel/peptides/opines) [Olavius algarvensis Delta 1 endosymbiont]|nr:ABC transporter, substrate-binding protein (cluster 5, nickel/peptides/opines) [Olavius algarvensis Delta 1 endosymbiont]
MNQLSAKSKLLANRWALAACSMIMIAALVLTISGLVEAAGKRGGALRMTMPTDLTQLDLHQTSAEIDNAVLGMTVYETLFTYDGKNNIKPFLVESYEFGNDGLLVTLNLKKGVKFHNGEEMTAEDVKFSLDRVRDDKLPGFHVNNLKKVTEVKITGPYQVQLVLSAKMANLLNYLATDVGTIAIMNKKDLQTNDNKVAKPVGTGPYMWRQWVKDSKVVLERFDGYSSADGPVDGMLGKRQQYVDRLEYYIMKEPATRIMALDKGDVDFTSILPYHMIDDLKKRDDVTVYSALPPDAVWYMYYVNFNHPILADVNFRKAMAYALDRGEITQAAVWGYGTPTFSVISPSLPAYTPDLEKMAPSYDPEKAQAFLKKSNYKGEKIKILTSKNYTPMYDQVVAAQAMWAAVGINTEIEIVDWATHLARWKKAEHEILSFAMIGRMNPVAQTWNLSSGNFYGYKNAKIDELRAKMNDTVDLEERNRLFREIYKITCEDVPYMINFYINNTGAYKKNLKGFVDYDAYRTRLWNLYLE